jgi:glucosylceramidase
MILKCMYVFCLIFTTVSSFSQQKVEMITTTEKEAWKNENNFKITSPAGKADVIINKNNTLQTIEGFGGCFNELGWTSLNLLKKPGRRSIMKELFTPGFGANFTICRMPVGANDFSLDWYSYNETEGDFEMKNFTIANDLKTLVPFIKESQQYAPNLKIWASPWSPPTWMKWNKHYACSVSREGLDKKYRNNLPVDRQGREGTDMFIQNDDYFKAYSLYFSRFIEEYRKQGIQVSMIMPQNEFNSCQIFPSCTWTATGLATFIGKYLGPEMEKQKIEIMFGTMERPSEALADTILNDPFAGKFIKGIGFQWAGKDAIPGLHKRYPDLKLYQTEQECGDGKNDWKYCRYAWTLMKHYISNGASAYMYWNISLEEGGISRWGWSQNSLITVNKSEKTFRYNHEFYLLKHLSHFVKPGAKFLRSSGTFTDLMAFINPDNSLVVVLHNDKITDQNVTISTGKEDINVLLKADSFNTLLIN